jgi:hypothetical protein
MISTYFPLFRSLDVHFPFPLVSLAQSTTSE